MRINPLFVLRDISDEYIVVPLGEEADRVEGILYLNHVGAFLWKMLEKDESEDSLVAAMVTKYDVEENVARRDVMTFLNELNRIGCLLDYYSE